MSYLSLSKEGYVLAEATQQVYIDQMIEAYSDALEEIDSLIAKLYAQIGSVDPKKYYTEALKYDRLKKTKDQIITAYNTAATKAGKATIKGLSNVMEDNYYRQLYLGNWIAEGLNPIPINPDVVKYAVSGNVAYWNKIQKSWGDMMMYTPQTGTLSELLKNGAKEELNAIIKAVNNGLISGKSYPDTVNGIKGIIGSYTKKKGKEEASGALYKSLRIARTEGARVMNASLLATGEQLDSQGFDTKKQWIATIDLSTRTSHQGLDGVKVGLNEEFHSSLSSGLCPGQMGSAADNINCRCRVSNIIDDVEPEIRRARNPVTGKNEVIGWTDYEEWGKTNNVKIKPIPKIKPIIKPVVKTKPKVAVKEVIVEGRFKVNEAVKSIAKSKGVSIQTVLNAANTYSNKYPRRKVNIDMIEGLL